ncbi:ABC transporter ATP-binding protein [Xanthocytophaga agilis]|uniref:ABC transporter ATP-binding protein n=1 Tax=Xanthocytophaga agilis TaxID=3048010 RepID=A0AAE3R8F0_9BACT|nr:ABC transporter ATP-binding protein [Xanthocytophaga agilis]MDJ1502658.1 ABC transporter ATP-binding protein [Xanthocytophaga agilis]
MSDIAIKVENLSKLYQIGAQKSGSLRDSLTKKWNQLRGSQKSLPTQDFWALEDISFEINKGEAVGLIGKNGAGKSTLLKILSRITEPAKGRIEINGRVASLLEVGTGFHPELSGRENVYLNGTILGMTRKEIKAKFDEIVEFSGVSKFIDTPVKFYSSGMYVRLAFAVAAHLEPEILIIDEVLAVGDAEFQKKCLGKMGEVAGQGRTVLFVSHNMTAVKALCSKGIVIQRGKIGYIGSASNAINHYLKDEALEKLSIETPVGNEVVSIEKFQLIPKYVDNIEKIDVRTPLHISIKFEILQSDIYINLSSHLYTIEGETIFAVASDSQNLEKGFYEAILTIPGNLLNDGNYMLDLMVVKDKSVVVYHLKEGLKFEVHDYREETFWHQKWPGIIRPSLPFTIQYLQKELL